jgi:precorrin-3B C17-methyltransferase
MADLQQQSEQGKLYVVGLGPGGALDMSGRARAAVESCDLIAGYTVYVDLLRDEFPDKEILTTPMRKEVERCRLALDAAAEGHSIAMVCSGDPGVYGMAGLIFELAHEYPPLSIEVIPGVSAANGGAAVLGAPLMHDYCVISLSDLLTPWEKIERRLVAAAQADFVITLYNPSSHKRPDYLQRACDILLQHKDGATVCGTVRNIGREGEEAQVMTLAELRDTPVDMFTTVFIGNSQTCEIDGRMVTPRGYLQRED